MNPEKATMVLMRHVNPSARGELAKILHREAPSILRGAAEYEVVAEVLRQEGLAVGRFLHLTPGSVVEVESHLTREYAVVTGVDPDERYAIKGRMLTKGGESGRDADWTADGEYIFGASAADTLMNIKRVVYLADNN